MKNLAKLTLSTLLLSSLTIHAYTPDLFGAYQQGAEAAREANARDIYYSQYANPTFNMGAYSGKTGKLKMTTRISIKDQDQFCWTFFNIPKGKDYYVIEQFVQPKDGLFNGHTANEIIKQERVSPNTIIFVRKTNSGNSNEIYGCYSFNEKTIKGKYSLTVKIGEYTFNTQNFTVVN